SSTPGSKTPGTNTGTPGTNTGTPGTDNDGGSNTGDNDGTNGLAGNDGKTPGLTTDDGPLDPKNDDPITGIKPADNLVKGLAGLISPLEITVKCALWSLANPYPLTQGGAFAANRDCVASYK